MKLEEIDKNFKLNSDIDREDLVLINALTPPFKIYGVKHLDGQYRRMPNDVAESVSKNVHALHLHTSGGRLRFRTNSPYIAIKAVMPQMYLYGHFAMEGSSGFDLYIDGVYSRSFIPPVKAVGGYESIIDIQHDGSVHDIMIGFPLYSQVSELYIGLKENCEILEPKPYTYEKPVVYYGSSITQGGCASRPSRAYPNILSNRLDCDFINLGFSGSAKGEDEMARYISELDMSVFVYDYEANAPNLEHLEKTHERFFKIIREKQPDLPIIIMPCPRFKPYWELHNMVKKTYENAVKNGDKNVYFIELEELLRLCGSEGTVDGSHPTDFGFESMARAVEPVLKKILK